MSVLQLPNHSFITTNFKQYGSYRTVDPFDPLTQNRIKVDLLVDRIFGKSVDNRWRHFNLARKYSCYTYNSNETGASYWQIDKNSPNCQIKITTSYIWYIMLIENSPTIYSSRSDFISSHLINFFYYYDSYIFVCCDVISYFVWHNCTQTCKQWVMFIASDIIMW